MYTVRVKGTLAVPIAGTLGCSGFSISSTKSSSRFSMVILSGRTTIIRRGVSISRNWRTLWSKRFVWIVELFVVTPSALTNDRIAPGGTPRRRRPISVYMRGSSQPSTYPPLTSLSILRFDRTVPSIESRPYSYWRGLYTSSASHSHSYDSRDRINSVVHSECEMFSKLSTRQCVKSYVGYMHHVVPVRWCGASSTRYAIRSHICGLPLPRMSCFMRSVASPGLYLPCFIASKSARLSSTGRSRQRLAWRAPFSGPPRCARISSGVEWSTYARPRLIRSTASS